MARIASLTRILARAAVLPRKRADNDPRQALALLPRSHDGTAHGWRRWVSIVLTTLRRAGSSVHSRSILRTALMTVE